MYQLVCLPRNKKQVSFIPLLIQTFSALNGFVTLPVCVISRFLPKTKVK